MKRFFAGAIALALLAACGSSGHDRPTSEVTAAAGDGRQTARVVLHSFYFEPNRIVVKAGIPVELTLKKASFFVPHNFTLRAPDAGIDVSKSVGFLGLFPGSAVVRFVPTRAGEYPFHCHKGNHMAKGMTGTLVVTE